MTLTFENVIKLVLAKFYFLAFRADHSGRVLSTDWRSVRPHKVSFAIVEKAVNELTAKGLLDPYQYKLTKKVVAWQISKKGIDLIEAELGKPDSFVSGYLDKGDPWLAQQIGDTEPDPHAWNLPDDYGAIPGDRVVHIDRKLKEIRDALDASDLSNSEKSQAIIIVDAAKLLASAPNPPWRKIKELLEPLVAIAVIAELIKAILHLVVGS
jgi:hypothetical protein